LLVFLIFTFSYLGKVKNYLVYDKLITITSIVILFGSGIIHTTRPPNFIVHVLMASISLFVLYLVIYNRFVTQVFLATATTIGEAIIILVILPSSEKTATFTVLFSLLFANLIGMVSAWQLHLYRRKSFQDLSKRQELQTKLEQYTKNLEIIVAERTEELKAAEQLAAIGATADMVGHDIRNPLTTITASLYLSKKKLKGLSNDEIKETLRKNFEVIEEQVEYINKIVSDLQDYSRPLHPFIQEIETYTLLKEALGSVKIPDNVKVDLHIDERLIKIKTDAGYVKRILINLLSNSVQAMPKGGKITLEATADGNKVRLNVKDTGQGIPDDVKTKLFKPLITTKSKGQGLGLVVVKRLVEALGGTVTFESEVGRGTKFTVDLPA